jgi:ADP-heptose:LPS heptosyltransferase
MNILIAKLGATGDVVRTTPLLRRLDGHITWVTANKNAVLLQGLQKNLKCLSWDERHLVPKVPYDLVINLEDTVDVGLFLKTFETRRLFGAYVDANGQLQYTDDAHEWFDLSLISRHGRKEADRLKLKNRRTYQDLIFAGLGLGFKNETYLLPTPPETDLSGDVAIAQESGPVWPMKNWAYYDELKKALEKRGLAVNVLPQRKTLLEHLGDVRNHRCLVGGDSLPMHFALGTGTPCVTLFNCTSPWEIHEYGLQKKIISPLLEEFFYKRDFDRRAITAISLEEVLKAVVAQIASELTRK